VAPELSTAMALVSMIEKMGGWQVGTILGVLFLVPPLLAYLGVRMIARALVGLRDQIAASEANTQKVLLEFVHRYDNNIELVKSYQRTSEALSDIIRRNTMAMTKLVDRIDTMREGR